MKEVSIRYRIIRWLPVYWTVKGHFPANWGEVKAKQLVAVACLYKNRISDLLFLKRMTGLPVRVLKRCDDFERYKLMEQLEFIGDRKPFHEFIIQRLTIRRPASWKMLEFLQAPGAKLKGVSFGQFIFADTYFSNYQVSQKEEDLNKFIASLYLRQNENFNEKLIQKRHHFIKHIDMATREAIVINYSLMHEWLALAYPLIFQKRQEMDKELASDTKVQGDPNSWIKIFQNFVGDDIIHDDVWAAKPINTIFTYMTRKYKENARRKS